MGRKSALTPDKWIEIERRIVVEGESAYALAKEFGINESSIRRKIKPNSADKADRAEKHHPELREIALKKVSAVIAMKEVDSEIAELPYAKQQIVSTFQSKFLAISTHLAGAAEYGAATSHRLSAIAHSQVQFLDDADPLDESGVEKLKVIAALTRTANEAAQTGVALINANKDRMSETPPLARTINPKKLSDATLKEILESRVV